MCQTTFQSALVRTMVCVSASNGNMHDSELKRIGDIVAALPAFAGFKVDKIANLASACAADINSKGFQAVLAGVVTNITNHVTETGKPQLWETAYALAADVAVADGTIDADERKMLLILADEFRLDALTASAIERGAQARFATA